MKNKPELSNILSAIGIAQLNDMQETALAAGAEHPDLILLSPTGSGKTLAFLLSIVEHLDADINGIQALIVTPTRELALQIESVFRKMQTNFKVNATYGGHSIRVEKNNLSEPPAVLVGTPGRITDHIRRGRLDFEQTRVLVLDEFDKCLEMGFEEDMTAIISNLENLQRRLLISATDLETIPAFTGLKNAHRVTFLKQSESRLKVYKVVCQDRDKQDTLLELICNIPYEPTLIFCNHREVVERVSDFLKEAGVSNVLFHGGLEQDERERALIRFRNGSADYMVTTDLAARGLDIPEIGNVIHYQLPLNEDAWVHRNGRTARQQADGNAYVLLTEKEYLPEYADKNMETLKLRVNSDLPPEPLFETLYFSAGKKDKVNKIDLVGFLSKVGGLEKDEVGLISVLDHSSFVAVAAWKAKEVLAKVRNEKVKGKKLKIAISR